MQNVLSFTAGHSNAYSAANNLNNTNNTNNTNTASVGHLGKRTYVIDA